MSANRRPSSVERSIGSHDGRGGPTRVVADRGDGHREHPPSGHRDVPLGPRGPLAQHFRDRGGGVERSETADRIERGPWHHWFVGYAKSPASGRTIAIATVLYSRREEAAGSTAARAAARFLRWWLEAEAGR